MTTLSDGIVGVEPVGIGKEIPLEAGVSGQVRQEVELRAIDPLDGIQEGLRATFAAEPLVLFRNLLDTPAFGNGDIE